MPLISDQENRGLTMPQMRPVEPAACWFFIFSFSDEARPSERPVNQNRCGRAANDPLSIPVSADGVAQIANCDWPASFLDSLNGFELFAAKASRVPMALFKLKCSTYCKCNEEIVGIDE
ncbi:hypothetical protein BH10PLA2_BH10PLA2_17060 [soil metagenome]